MIWITTRARGPVGDEKHDLNEIQLTEFHPATGASATRTIEKLDLKKRTGLIAPIAVDEDGSVWLGWRQMIGRFEPSSGALRRWSLPSAALDPNPNASGSDGYPTSIAARKGDVWVVVAESPRLWHFDTRTGRWDSISLGRLVPGLRSTVAVTGDGRLAVNGVVWRSKNAVVGRLTIVDPGKRVARLGDFVVDRLVDGGDGLLVVVDEKGNVRRVDPATDARATEHVRAGGIDVHGPVALDHLGQIWFTASATRRILVVRTDLSAGTRAAFDYPVETGTINRGPPGAAGPRLVAFDPSLEALIPDIRGDVWVVSQHGGGAVYPPVYRLRPA